MKKILFGCLVAIGWMAIPTATAQNYGCPTEYCCTSPNFDGFYVGGNVGVLSHTAHRNDFDGFFGPNASYTTTRTAATAGLQFGYDWACCNSVWGFVADWNWSHAKQDLRTFISDGTLTLEGRLHNKLNWYTTLRLRAGVPICNALFYVTGGAAVARFDTRWNSILSVQGVELFNFEFRDNKNRWGWVGGAGLEYNVWCNWSLGAEFLCMHFSHRRRSFVPPGGDTPFHFGTSDTVYVGRLFLNYRFGNLCCS